MKIRLAVDGDKAVWDAFVSEREEATPYHRFAWREAVEKAYGHQGCYLMAEDDNRIIGVLPLVVMRFPMFYKKVVSIPFCDLGGALAIREDVAQHLYDEAIVIAKRMGAGSLEFRCRVENAALQRSGLLYEVRTDKASMILPLPGSASVLWGGFKSKLRSQVRKAEKNNLFFIWGEKKDRADFYSVFSKNMRELGSPVHAKGWIDTVLDSFGPQARMGLVYYDKVAVGAGIILCQGRKVSIPWASTLREFNNFSPNMLLYWNFLQFAADAGYMVFDFGRSTRGEGTYKFKAQWGAEPQTLYWYDLHMSRCHAKKKSRVARPGESKQRLAAIWSMLPLPLANFFGPYFRRHISL